MKYRLTSFSFWRRLVLFGGLMIIGFGGFYFLSVPAKTQGIKNPWQPVAQPNTFSISGQVTYDSSPVSGVTVNLSGTTNAAVLTDAFGNYQFSGLAEGGNYSVSPSFVRY